MTVMMVNMSSPLLHMPIYVNSTSPSHLFVSMIIYRPNLSHSYNIISTFPSQIYNDKSSTLEECGLIPNATLHLKAKKR